MTSEPPALDVGQRVEVVASRIHEKQGKHHLDGASGIVRHKERRGGYPFALIELRPEREDGVSGNVWVPEVALKRTE